jgi:hypothetical protein
MIHRANSEGLLEARRRVKRRRAKGAYIGFGGCHCQRLRSQNTREKARAIARPFLFAAQPAGPSFCAYSGSARRTMATFLRRPFLNGVGSVAMWGRDNIN